MASGHKIAVWVSIAAGLILLSTALLRRYQLPASIPFTAEGSILKQDPDTRKQSPVADVEVSAAAELDVANAKSDFSGYFKIMVPPGTNNGETVLLHFRHPDYQPVDLNVALNGQPNVIRMIPIHSEVESAASASGEMVANVQLRYTTEINSTENIGAGVRIFQVLNAGGVPCSQHLPCSPDGKWKAAIETASLDAGDGNVFEHARVTCIAGPCPFTKIDHDNFSQNARAITVTARNWSDTATFLMQAEVFHTQVRDIVRRAYPIIFGRSLNFTVPADAEGVTLEAELNGTQIIFPLPLEPSLSWADCKMKVDQERGRDYRCELKSGFRFQ